MNCVEAPMERSFCSRAVRFDSGVQRGNDVPAPETNASVAGERISVPDAASYVVVLVCVIDGDCFARVII